MYDQLFSSAWIFDRCQEIAAYFMPAPIVLGCLILLSLIVLIFSKKKMIFKDKILLSVASAILTPLFIFLAYVVLFLIGGGLFRCTASARYWPTQDAAVFLNAELNHVWTYGLPLPKNEKELRDQYPEYINQISKTAKFAYAYDETGPRYTLLVRSSKYLVALYDSALGRVTYRIPMLFNPAFAGVVPWYPPTEPGPWEMLPQ